MAEFRTVCKLSELNSETGKTVAVGSRLVALFLVDGQPCAIDDVCPHMGASLGAGEVENGVVTCPWHGWRFRVTDGTWADNPRIKIAIFPVRVVGEDVQIQILERETQTGAAT
jgi:nitrite reductase (NADH) small subunit/3-phenylpropionate/trans-cinnamate dioxygenase ferredoxin subunit